MNPKLKDAVEIFDKLGWRYNDRNNVLTLPIGTEEEQKLALQGLRTGAWVKRGNAQNQWTDTYLAFQGKNAIFTSRKLLTYAVRLGISVKRLLQLMDQVYYDEDQLIVAILSRGEEYVLEFSNHACVANTRWENGKTRYGHTVVGLVLHHGAQIPENTEYLLDWLYLAKNHILDVGHMNQFKMSLSDFTETFSAHVNLCDKLGIKEAVHLPTVVTYGIEQNLLNRVFVLELAMNGLDNSVRPSDRKRWYEVVEVIDITDEELCQRVGLLNPILASGDNYLINELAPRLIANVDEKDLMETLLSAFSTTTKKGKLLVLKAAFKRNLPISGEELAPWLNIYVLDKDASISKTAQALMDKWQLSAEIDTFEETVEASVWQTTPDVWELPDFELGEVTSERLTELASLMMRRRGEDVFGGDLDTERFLAVSVALAYHDEEEAKLALSGMRASWGILNDIKAWTRGELEAYRVDSFNWLRNPIDARNGLVVQKFGKIPCLLSTPSRMDLSITLADLVKRIKRFKVAGADVIEGDFLLALCRLDVTTRTDALIKEIKGIGLDFTKEVNVLGTKKVVVRKQGDVGEIVVDYLDDPVVEPSVRDKHGDYVKETPRSLKKFPKRLEATGYRADLNVFTVPHFKKAGFDCLIWNQGYEDHGKGRNLLQMAHRGEPLPANAVVNFLATFRSDTTEDCWEALKLAWERGLIRPRVAEVALMDGENQGLKSLASLANAFELMIEEGLLSVVWPLMDDIVKKSVSGTKVVTGTNEIVDLMAKYLPTVLIAVADGRADECELFLSGIRLLATKKGKSRGVIRAQEMVALLPVVDLKESVSVVEIQEEKVCFEDVWVVYKCKDVIDDKVEVVVKESSGTAGYLFTLFVSELSGFKYQIQKGWTHDLEHEGHTQAVQVECDAEGYTTIPWGVGGYLRWCTTKQHLVYEKNREWRKKGLDKKHEYPLSLLTVILGILGQKADYYVDSLLSIRVQKGHLTPLAVRRGIEMLIKSPEFNVGLLMRHLEKSSKYLSVLYPVLVVAANHAGVQVAKGEKLPKWTNRILDVTLLYGEYLVEAKNRRLINEADFIWDGLAQIVAMKGKSVAKEKALRLIEIFGL